MHSGRCSKSIVKLTCRLSGFAINLISFFIPFTINSFHKHIYLLNSWLIYIVNDFSRWNKHCRDLWILELKLLLYLVKHNRMFSLLLVVIWIYPEFKVVGILVGRKTNTGIINRQVMRNQSEHTNLLIIYLWMKTFHCTHGEIRVQLTRGDFSSSIIQLPETELKSYNLAACVFLTYTEFSVWHFPNTRIKGSAKYSSQRNYGSRT